MSTTRKLLLTLVLAVAIPMPWAAAQTTPTTIAWSMQKTALIEAGIFAITFTIGILSIATIYTRKYHEVNIWK